VGAAGIPARLTGGVAIRRRCQSATREPLARTYADVDMVVKAGGQDALTEVMVELGYVPNRNFNLLHGSERLYFLDLDHGRHVDVFVGSIRMCHTLDMSARLERLDDTLTVTDLLLTKLQVVELNRKDLVDLIALLLDHEISAEGNDDIDAGYLAQLLRSNWPLWRTCQLTLGKVLSQANDILPVEAAVRVGKRVATLQDLLDDIPKTRVWKLRAVIGDRVRWYNLPDEVE